MGTDLKKIYEQIGITPQHLESNKLEFHLQPSLDRLKVVDIDFEGKPFILFSDAAEAWLNMKSGASKEKIHLQPFSGFRSYLHQKRLIENHLKNGRAIESILTHIAIPGFSEHHTGCAIDIHANENPVLEEAFENSEEFYWLDKNASRYGFRLSYPRSNTLGIIYEPWHWYFVGKQSL
jgi:D-alanyl-D-alanine carboxypeptidase